MHASKFDYYSKYTLLDTPKWALSLTQSFLGKKLPLCYKILQCLAQKLKDLLEILKYKYEKTTAF